MIQTASEAKNDQELFHYCKKWEEKNSQVKLQKELYSKIEFQAKVINKLKDFLFSTFPTSDLKKTKPYHPLSPTQAHSSIKEESLKENSECLLKHRIVQLKMDRIPKDLSSNFSIKNCQILSHLKRRIKQIIDS
jgi:hypothetical protein